MRLLLDTCAGSFVELPMSAKHAAGVALPAPIEGAMPPRRFRMTKATDLTRRSLGALLLFLGLTLSFSLAAQTHQARELSFTEQVIRYSGWPPSTPIAAGDVLYGTTQRGGRYGWGTLYRVGRDGVMQVLHDFGPAEAEPVEVTLGDDGALYGITRFGGRSDGGTLFRYSLDGTYEMLADFIARTGRFPNGLRKSRDGVVYGVTVDAGAHRWGTVFRVSAQQEIEVLHSFETYGEASGAPMLASDGKLYGVLQTGGGPLNNGAVYRLDTEGRYGLLFEFGRPPLDDAEHAYGPLMQAVDGALYGSTRSYSEVRSGYVYRLQLDGQVSVLHTFDDLRIAQDGQYPNSGLALGKGGVLYGATESGGPNGYGTVYGIALDGSFRLLYGFGGRREGRYPIGVTPLARDRFAGTTEWGGNLGTRGFGTLFLLTPLPQERFESVGESTGAVPTRESHR
jgi:uncharacterized repeat protein (TIGR03803 family)